MLCYKEDLQRTRLLVPPPRYEAYLCISLFRNTSPASIVSNSFPYSRSTDEDIVDWDVDQFYHKSYGAHNEEPNTHSLADFDKFATIRFCTSVDEECAVFDKVPWDINELLELVGHACRQGTNQSAETPLGSI